LTTKDATLNAYLAAAADPGSATHKALVGAVSTADKWRENNIWEQGAVTVIDPRTGTVVGTVPVNGKGAGSVISSVDVQSAIRSLDPAGTMQGVFYHDHTDYGGRRSLSDADVTTGWRNNNITLARSGDEVFIMRPLGSSGGNPSLRFYLLPASALGLP
jgi:hypothetical protein